MCILLKLYYAKFDVPSWFCSKVIEGKSLGGRLDLPPLVKEGLTLFDVSFFNHQVCWGHEGPHHNFVVTAPMIMKFGTGVKLDVFYTMVTKNCDIITITPL